MTRKPPLETYMTNDDLKSPRKRLLAEITEDAVRTTSFTGRTSFSPNVMRALEQVPRERFVPEPARHSAYENRPLSIGHNQTISQPYIVALMTDLLDLKSSDRVLEIGTGCGYQTAMLATLSAEVYTIELIPELQEGARKRLSVMGHTNIQYRIGNGWSGWAGQAPFNAIIVTAAADETPAALTAQLGSRGRMVVPIGRQHEPQFLTRLIRDSDGVMQEERGLPVAFVPLVKIVPDNS